MDSVEILTMLNALTERQKEAVVSLVTAFTDNELSENDKLNIDEGLEDLKAGRVHLDSDIDWDKIGQ